MIFAIDLRSCLKKCSTVFRRLALLTTAVGLLSNCASLSEEECLYLDWRAKGVIDGSRGEPQGKVLDYQKSCDRYGITVDAEAFETGRVVGLEQYCTEANGFTVGMSGTKYRDACTDANSRDFLRTYVPARRLYVAHSNLRNAERAVESSSWTITYSEREIDRNLKRLRAEALTDEEREEIETYNRKLERDIDDARERRMNARQRIPELEGTCRSALRRLAAFGYEMDMSCASRVRDY